MTSNQNPLHLAALLPHNPLTGSICHWAKPSYRVAGPGSHLAWPAAAPPGWGFWEAKVPKVQARLHAASEKTALVAERAFLSAVTIGEAGPLQPLVMDRIG